MFVWTIYQHREYVEWYLEELEEGDGFDGVSEVRWMWEEEHASESCVDNVRMMLGKSHQLQSFPPTVSSSPERQRWLVVPRWTSVCLDRHQVQWHTATAVPPIHSQHSGRPSVIIITMYSGFAVVRVHLSVPSVHWTSCSHSRTLLLAWSLEPENSTASHLWCENFTGYQFGKGSGLRQPFWSSNVSMDWLQNICLSTTSWRPAVHICNQSTRACCLFRAHGQPTVTGVLLSVDHSRGTVYLWHCDQVTSRRRLSEDISV